MPLGKDDIIYDWNSVVEPRPLTQKPFELYDETLRDGVQSPSVVDPPIEKKIEILHLIESLSIQCADIGLPGAGNRAYDDTLSLAQEIARCRLNIKPACAARTHPNDIQPVIDISQKAGIPIEITAFLGSSPIRQFVEGWDLDRMLRMSAEAIDLGIKAGLPVSFVTEDTIRSSPETLEPLFRNAIDHGATRLILCDTCGHATPDGVQNLFRFTQNLLDKMGVDVLIDWHGHNDRGLAVTNTIRAIEAGADRVHATALGVGERVGNAAMDQLLINLKLMGEIDWDLSNLLNYCLSVSESYKIPIPFNYPMAGRDAFRTATGGHASAIIKAQQKGDKSLEDNVYSGVPAGMFGKSQEIEINHMSGLSNVIYWLNLNGIEQPEEGLAEHILNTAKRLNHTLSDEELRALVDGYTQ